MAANSGMPRARFPSFWLDTAPPFEAGAREPIAGRYDVAIVGAGLTGLSAALSLARRGAKVIVMEADRVVGDASGRNGGHCNNGLSHDFASISERFGLERAKEMYLAFDAAVDHVETLVDELGIDCDFVRSGKLKLAAKPEHFPKMARNQELLARHVDPETSVVEPSDLRAEIGSDLFYGGVLQRRSASLHVGRFGVALATAASKAGAHIHEQTTVTAIERLGAGRFRLTAGRAMVEADSVILATGSSRHGPLGWLRRRVIPIGSFVIVTEPLEASVARSIMPGRRNCTTSQNIGFYFRMSADNRLVFGGRARFAMSSPRSDAKSGAILERHMQAMFPQLRGARIDYCWGGLVDITRDRLPRCGVHDGMHFAAGFSGHGVQMSTLMGHIMALRLLGDAVANPWRDIDWPAVPGHFGTPWFLPAVGAYYRLMDRLH